MPGSDNHIGILSDFAAHKRVPYGFVFELFDGEMNIDFIFEAEWRFELTSDIDTWPADSVLTSNGQSPTAKECMLSDFHVPKVAGIVNDSSHIGL
jgi:hypothetical protein